MAEMLHSGSDNKIPITLESTAHSGILQAKSSLSTQATLRPRNRASRAAPAPVAPPPIIKTSYSSPSLRSSNIEALEGILYVSLGRGGLKDSPPPGPPPPDIFLRPLGADDFLNSKARDERREDAPIIVESKCFDLKSHTLGGQAS